MENSTNTNFLVDLLKLSDSIISGDLTQIDTVIASLTTQELSEDQKNSINGTLIDLGRDSEYSKALTQVVPKLSFINQEYILALIKLYNINIQNVAEATVAIKALLNNTIQFDTAFNKYSFYSTLANNTIRLRDVTLIKEAIDKLQAI